MLRTQVTHNSASFFVEAFDRSGNAVHGFIGEHLPLKVCCSSVLIFETFIPHRYADADGCFSISGFGLVQ